MGKKSEWEEAEEQKNYLKERQKDSIEAEKSKMDKRAEMILLERRKQMERVEKEMEDKLEKERDNGIITSNQRQRERRLAAEMSRLKREEAREHKLREQLRESSEELKLLESKLRAGYVGKQLITQMAEKEAMVAQEKLEKVKIQQMIEAEEKCMGDQAQQNEYSSYISKYKYRDELLGQINEGNKKEKDKQRDLLLEKALLEQAMRKLREEDEREKEAQKERLKQVKQEIEEFQTQKEIRKQNEKISKEEFEKKTKAYAEEKERQEQKTLDDLKEKAAMKEKIRDQITLAYLSKMKSTNDREEIIALLAEEDLRQRDLKKDKEKADAASKLKEEFLNAYKNYAEQKEIAWKEDFENQYRYKNQLLEKIALEEKLDKASAGNKESRSKEYREALLQQMRDRHKLQIEDWQRKAALDKLQEVEENERMRIVEEERLRMLKAHVGNLIGYLPRGVLHENDLRNLGPELSKKLQKNNTADKS